jgi:hypothetical protein
MTDFGASISRPLETIDNIFSQNQASPAGTFDRIVCEHFTALWERHGDQVGANLCVLLERRFFGALKVSSHRDSYIILIGLFLLTLFRLVVSFLAGAF